MKKIIRILGVGFSFILMLSLSSCYYDEAVEDISQPIDDVSYANDIQPVWDQSCVSCHGGAIDPDMSEGISYNVLINIPGSIIPGDAEGSELMEMLNHDPGAHNPMPPSGPMSAANLNLIEAWINQGALNN